MVGDGAEGAGSAVAVIHEITLPSGPPPSGTIRRMQQTEKIWRNGSFVPWDEANVHVLTHALHYGTGVFEGIRAYETPRGTAVFRLTDHLERLRRSAALYEMDLGYTVPRAGGGVHETVAVNSVSSCYVRPIAFRGDGQMGLYPRDNPVEIAVAVWPWGAYLGEEALEHGVQLQVSSYRRIGPEHAAADRQGVGPVHQLGAREARGEPRTARRGDPPERGGLRRRRLRRERVRGPRRRAAHAPDDRIVPTRGSRATPSSGSPPSSATTCAR